jgi:hypothetical protein
MNPLTLAEDYPDDMLKAITYVDFENFFASVEFQWLMPIDCVKI